MTSYQDSVYQVEFVLWVKTVPTVMDTLKDVLENVVIF